MLRNVAHQLKWAWLVPTIPLPPDDRLIDNSILPAIRRLPSFVDRRPALLCSPSLYRAHDQALMAHCTALPLAAVTRALLASAFSTTE
jgi:hypothetical protein